MRSREALVDAASDLWGREGFDAVKVEDICERAGVSKGLFYFYFGSKEDLLVEIVHADADAVAEVVSRGIEAGEPVEAILQKAIAVVVRRAQRRPRHLLARGIAEWFAALERHSGSAVGHTSLEQSLTDLFAHGQERGEVAGDWTAGEIGSLLAVALVRATFEWATSATRQPSLLRRLSARTDLVMRGAAAG